MTDETARAAHREAENGGEGVVIHWRGGGDLARGLVHRQLIACTRMVNGAGMIALSLIDDPRQTIAKRK